MYILRITLLQFTYFVNPNCCISLEYTPRCILISLDRFCLFKSDSFVIHHYYAHQFYEVMQLTRYILYRYVGHVFI